MTDKETKDLYERFFRQARALVWKIKKQYDDELAWDIAGKGILELEAFKGDSDVMSWFYKLAKNEIVDAIRKEKRKNEKSLEELSRVEFESLASESNVISKIIFEEIVYQKGEKEIVQGRLEGKSFKEIGWELGVSENVVWKRWNKFVERMRREKEE